MAEKVTFKYFEGQDVEQFTFYRIPKQLFTVSCFKDLSLDAKILYGLMLDRISLSVKKIIGLTNRIGLTSIFPSMT